MSIEPIELWLHRGDYARAERSIRRDERHQIARALSAQQVELAATLIGTDRLRQNAGLLIHALTQIIEARDTDAALELVSGDGEVGQAPTAASPSLLAGTAA